MKRDVYRSIRMGSLSLALGVLFAGTAAALAQAADAGEHPGGAAAERSWRDYESDRPVRDRVIARTLQRNLILARDIPSDAVQVEVRDRVVTLSGQVETLKAKEKALEIARAMAGVRDVKDRLELEPVDWDDRRIRSHVMMELGSEPAVSAFDLDVGVDGGVVTLRGPVDSWAERRVAEEVAKDVPGVQEVQNGLSVLYRIERPDWQILSDVEALFESDVRIEDTMIRLDVDSGVVRLEGIVTTHEERNRALAAAWVAGVHDVDARDLRVDPTAMPARATMRWQTRWQGGPGAARFREDEPGLGAPDRGIERGSARGAMRQPDARSGANRDEAIRREVNRLEVQRPGGPDSRLEARVRERLWEAAGIDPRMIDVEVHEGRASLMGTVESHDQKWAIERAVSQAPGIVDVQNNLRIRPPAARVSAPHTGYAAPGPPDFPRLDQGWSGSDAEPGQRQR